MAGYDGKTCPGCDETVRGAYALLFNAMNRFGEPTMIGKLWDLKVYHQTLGELAEDAHPAVRMMHDVHAKIIVAMEGVTFEQSTGIIRWVPGVMEYLKRLETEWVDALVAYQEILDEHNRDNRHTRGEMNVLRESRGSEHNLWGRREGNTSYDHFVRVHSDVLLDKEPWELNPHEGDLRCARCKNVFDIADHFKDQLRSDPTFYGAFDCPKCRNGAIPWAEVEVLFA